MTTAADEDWYTLDTLTFLEVDRHDAENYLTYAHIKVIEALTHDRQVVEVVYYAEGDYIDRWVDVTGQVRDIVFWRPCRG